MKFYLMTTAFIISLFVIVSDSFPVSDQQKAAIFLQKIGYFGDSSGHGAGNFLGPEAISNALNDFQRFAGDKQTGSTKWEMHLTYNITKYATRQDGTRVGKEIASAFKLWENATGLSFEERKTSQVKMDMRFESDAHGEGNNMDGPGLTLAEVLFQQYEGSFGQPPLPAEEEPVVSPPNASEAPDLCKDATIDTAIRMQNGNIYFFKGDFYWKYLSDSIAEGYPRKISDDWDGLEGNLDASVALSNGKTYFFKDRRYWRFTNRRMNTGFPKLLNHGFEGIPEMVEAAVVWSGTGKAYFFKGDSYWRFDLNDDPPATKGYPAPISSWNGLPDYIDAALEWENNITYFFKGDQYYRYNDIISKVHKGDPPYPRSTAYWWFNCK